MRALSYLLRTTIKNMVLQIVKNPAKLIAFLLFFALIGLSLLSSITNDIEELQTYRDIKELYAICLLLYMIIFFMMTLKGLSSGGSFYSMADVNLLFLTPIAPKMILIYGLVKQMGTSLVLGFFLIFQYGWLHGVYGLAFTNILVILLGYCVIVFIAQLFSIIIYSFTSSNEKRKKLIKFSFVGMAIVLSGMLFYPMIINNSFTISDAVHSLNDTSFSFFPVVGWVHYSVIAFLNGHFISAVVTGAGIVIFTTITILLFSKMKSDFYEDVLQATEVSFSAITAKKEGQVKEFIPQNVKVGKVGIKEGAGANVFLYKHKLENRRGKIAFIDVNSLIYIAFIIGFSIFMREAGIIAVFTFATYMQFFTIATGKWVRELTMPYVYLIPEGSFKKLVYLSIDGIYKCCIEAVLIFIPVSLIVGTTLLETLFVIIARIGFGILFIAATVFSLRVFGSIESKMVEMFLFFIMILILALPGIILAFITASIVPASISLEIGFLVTFVVNTIVSAILVFFCKDILHNAELNNR